MTCENGFCVYKENGCCLLDKIHLDSDGKCTQCIYVEFPDEIVKTVKENLRRQLKNAERGILDEIG